MGPVLLPVVPVGLRPGTQAEWKQALETLVSERYGRSSPKARGLNGLCQSMVPVAASSPACRADETSTSWRRRWEYSLRCEAALCRPVLGMD